MKADAFLTKAAQLMAERGKDRDNVGERSMARCVAAFNAMTGHELTEEDGWQFMVYLKHSRARGGNYRRDDYEDAVAYAALSAEAASKVPEEEITIDFVQVHPTARPMFFDNTKDGGLMYPPNDKDT
jgi:hypothetical protein